MESSVERDEGRPKPLFRRVSYHAQKTKHPATWVMSAIIFSLIVIAVGVFFGYNKNIYKSRTSIGDTSNTTDLVGMFLNGQMTGIDTVGGNFYVSWYTGNGCGVASDKIFSPQVTIEQVYGLAESQLTPDLVNVVCGQSIVNFNIYTQENASSQFATLWTTSQWSVTSGDYMALPDGSSEAMNVAPQSFNTQMPFDLGTQLDQDKRATTLAYPFDQYSATIVFPFANTANNKTIPVANGYIQSDIPNWTVSSVGYQVNVCANVTLDHNLDPHCIGLVPDPLQRYAVKIMAHRAASTIAFVIWVTNWIITLVIVWTTMEIVLFKSNLPPELILVPLTALFSLPAVRSVMPDAPNFGSYLDLGGFIFNLTLISMSAATVLIVGIRRNFKRGTTKDKDGKDDD